MRFSSTRRYRYKKGRLFLGKTPIRGKHVGIETDRHAICFGGARGGKGAGLIIPNLTRWPHNSLTIDPKGEAAEATFAKLEQNGQTVHVVDPFNDARVPDRLRAQYNPLDELDMDAMTIREDIQAISDGTVMRSNPSGEYWDNGGQTIISGLIAYVKARMVPEDQNLLTVRKILASAILLKETMAEMERMFDVCAGLCVEAHAAYSAKEGHYFVSSAQSNTRWLNSRAMENSLKQSSFSMRDLKHKKASVFLVLPANYLNELGLFLRLFVRAALEAMAHKTEDGELKDRECLFLLDEFFSLGFISEISKSAGLMPGYGLTLFPILQDLGQLQKLYGQEGAGTFFGNSDAHIFFANTDQITLEYISRTIGTRYKAGLFGGDEDMVGKPLMTTQEVKQHVRKMGKGKLARRMIVFGHGDEVLSLKLHPYWKD